MSCFVLPARAGHAVCVAALLCVVQACGDAPSTAVSPVATATSNTAYRGAAFILDVNTTRRTVKVSPPVTGVLPSALRNASSAPVAINGQHASLLGADVIEMQISNYAAGPVGAVVPGKALVTFDLTLVNRLNGITLGTPTFPRPPAGVSGVQAFPFEVSVLTSPGGVNSQGNEVVVTSPSFGQAIASVDWDGAPHSFFNDADCGGASNDCFRYEPFGTIGANSASAARRVGFLIDPTVRDLRIKLLVAADVRAAAAATTQ